MAILSISWVKFSLSSVLLEVLVHTLSAQCCPFLPSRISVLNSPAFTRLKSKKATYLVSTSLNSTTLTIERLIAALSMTEDGGILSSFHGLCLRVDKIRNASSPLFWIWSRKVSKPKRVSDTAMILSMHPTLMTQVSSSLSWATTKNNLSKKSRTQSSGSFPCKIKMEVILLSIKVFF